MQDTDMKLSAIRDQLAGLLGMIDDCSNDPAEAGNKEQLLQIARMLRENADEIHKLVVRLKK